MFNNIHRSRVRQSREFWEQHKIILPTLSPSTTSFIQQVSAYGLLISWQCYVCGADMSMEVLGDSSLGQHYLWSVVHEPLLPRFCFLIPSAIILGASVRCWDQFCAYWGGKILELQSAVVPERRNFASTEELFSAIEAERVLWMSITCTQVVCIAIIS